MNRPPWKVRRRIVIGTLLFCAFVVLWLAIRGADTELSRSIASGAFMLAGAVIGSYVFGAAWDDFNVMKTAGLEPYQAPETDEPAPLPASSWGFP